MTNFELNDKELKDTAAASITNRVAEKAALETELEQQQQQLAELADTLSPLEKAERQHQILAILVDLERGAEGWSMGRAAFSVFLEQAQWEAAADCCRLLFEADQPGSLSALGQGIWLAVTFPIDSALTLALLEHVVDETPTDSDGAAVAAAAALFLVDLRAAGKEHQRLHFFASQMLGNVARRHSEIETQEAFTLWVERLQLNNPDQFLPRLRTVVTVLVQDDWWFDPDALQAQLPM